MLQVALLLSLGWVLIVSVTWGYLSLRLASVVFACGLLLASGVALWRAVQNKKKTDVRALVSYLANSSWFSWVVIFKALAGAIILVILALFLAGKINWHDIFF